MPNTLPKTWVKNVYSLWAQGVVNRVNKSTPAYQSPITVYQLGVKPQLIPQLVNTFPPGLPTSKIAQLTDAISRLSTLSTTPTIKKKR